MFRKNEGFFLTELLLSLSAWLIATGILLPLVFHLTYQSYRLYLENTATHILYDELGKMSVEGIEGSNKTVSRNGIAYVIKWIDATKEVCVTFEDANKEKVKKCQIFE